MSGFKIEQIMQFSDVTKKMLLDMAPADAIDDVAGEMAKWGRNGVDELPEVTIEEVEGLMASIVFGQIAVLANPPPQKVYHVLSDLNYSTLRHIKVHIVQQALRLGRARAKVDRLETVIEQLQAKINQLEEILS